MVSPGFLKSREGTRLLPEEYKILSFVMERDRRCLTKELVACDGFEGSIWENMRHQADPCVKYLQGPVDYIDGCAVPMYVGMTDKGVHDFLEEQERLELFCQSAIQKAQEEAKKEKQRLQDIRRSWWQFGLRLVFDLLLFLSGWVLGGFTFSEVAERIKALFQ